MIDSRIASVVRLMKLRDPGEASYRRSPLRQILHGTFLAILGVDFVTDEIRNTLTTLKFFCVGLVLFSLLLSVVSSYYMARKLSFSLG